jgi:3-oxoadipate enol-lactonase
MSIETRREVVATVLGELHVHDAGPVQGPVALLWPSLFSDGYTSWGVQLPGLHALGWRTLLVDPPGTGDSPPARRRFTMEDCAQAALQVLDATSVDDAAILGLSWGGFVGLRVAIAQPRRVTGLVLSNTSARRASWALRMRDRTFSGMIRVGVPGGPGRLVAAGMLSKHSRRTDTELVGDLVRTVDGLDGRGLAIAAHSVLVDRTNIAADLELITVPTLVIGGAEDTALPAPHYRELADAIPGARLEILPRVGHLAPREAPDKVSHLMREFLPSLGGDSDE